MPTLTLILAALATYRLATDLAWEAGPLALYSRWRGWVLTRYGADHWLSEGVSCPICLSFWLAPIALLVTFYVPPIALWLAVAGAAALAARARP